MHYNHLQYTYQQRNEDFPEKQSVQPIQPQQLTNQSIKFTKNNQHIGKILSKYSNNDHDISQQSRLSSRVRNGIHLNYQQMFKDIKLNNRDYSANVLPTQKKLSPISNRFINNNGNYASTYEFDSQKPKYPSSRIGNYLQIDKKQYVQQKIEDQQSPEVHENIINSSRNQRQSKQRNNLRSSTVPLNRGIDEEVQTSVEFFQQPQHHTQSIIKKSDLHNVSKISKNYIPNIHNEINSQERKLTQHYKQQQNMLNSKVSEEKELQLSNFVMRKNNGSIIKTSRKKLMKQQFLLQPQKISALDEIKMDKSIIKQNINETSKIIHYEAPEQKMRMRNNSQSNEQTLNELAEQLKQVHQKQMEILVKINAENKNLKEQKNQFEKSRLQSKKYSRIQYNQINHQLHDVADPHQQNPQRSRQLIESPNSKIALTEKEQQQDQPKQFEIQDYTKIYPILRNMQNALKSSLIDAQSLIRGVKAYLQLVAQGTLDNIDNFDLQLHKKKIIKTALLYERIAIIVIAFAYANQTLKQSHKYLINLLSYALSTALLLVKVLQSSKITPNSNEVIKKSDRLVMKKSIDTIRNNNDVLIDSIYKLSKYDHLFYQNLKQMVKLLHKSSLQQTFYNVLEYFAFFLCVSDMYQMLPFLAVAPDPYLPPSVSQRYTLVIDVVEVFCQGTKKANKHHIFRPYSDHFLNQMSQYYDIVTFSNSLPNQIDKLINLLDPKGHIKYRLYKHHGLHKLSAWVKVLQRLGRNLSGTILLDDQNGSGQLCKQNCIHIPQWKGNKNDTVLAELCPVLAMIALKKLDVRNAINKIRSQAYKNQKEGVKYVNFGLTLD